MKPSVYIETSISSFYYETRTEPEMVARRSWTRQWWNDGRHAYEVVTSEAVLDGLSAGIDPNLEQALPLANILPCLPVASEIAEIVQAYIEHRVRPQDRLGIWCWLPFTSATSC